jgi:hypothetical protein
VVGLELVKQHRLNNEAQGEARVLHQVHEQRRREARASDGVA